MSKKPDFHTVMLLCGFTFDDAWQVNKNLYTVRYKRDNMTVVISIPVTETELLLNVPEIANRLYYRNRITSNKVMNQC